MKKRVILSLLLNAWWLLGLPYQATAQTETKELKFDSLERANEKYLKQDETKLKMLNALAFGYPKVNPGKGIEAGEQAISLAQTLKNPLLLAEAFNNKALNHIAKGEYPLALELYEKALDLNKSNNNRYGIAHNTYNIGDLFRQKGDKKKAYEYFENAFTIFEEIKNEAGLVKVYNGFAILNLASDPNKSLEYLQKAISIVKTSGNKSGIAQILGTMGVAYYNLSENQKALNCYQEALGINEQLGNKILMAANFGNIGLVYMNLSEYPKALEYLQKALAINEQLGSKNGMAGNLSNMGNVYYNISDFLKALEYYKKALILNEQLGLKNGMLANLGNIGSVYFVLSDSDCAKLGITPSEKYLKALEYYQKALALNEQLGRKNGNAVILGNIGNVYYDLYDYPKALEYYQKALDLHEQFGNKEGIAANLGYIGKLYFEAPDSIFPIAGIEPAERFTKAMEYQNKCLQMAQEIGDVLLQKLAWQNMSNIFEKQGNFSKAHEAYKNYIVLRDSIESDEVKKNIERKEMQFEFDKKETEIKFQQQLTEEKLLRSNKEAALNKQQLLLSNKEKDLQHLAYLKEKAEKQQKEDLLSLSEKDKQLQQAKLVEISKQKEIQEKELSLSQAEVKSKNLQRNGFIIGSALLFLLAGAIFIGLRRTAKEKKKSDNLLLNILPAEVAEELKTKGSTDAKQYQNVTVLFTDFVNFTGISEQLSPTELVEEIHNNFTAFDAIIEKHGLEKIKTIGDAYLAVCGLPHETADHALRVVHAAQDILRYMQQHAGKFQVRIGIHSGSVVAGIVGVKKFAYDIWGDTVNTAARMEQKSEACKINISGSTYNLVKDKLSCIYRGKIEAKNKGNLDMYFVEIDS